MSVAGAKSKTLSPRNNIHSCAVIYVISKIMIVISESVLLDLILEVCGFIAFIFFYFCLREAIVETVAECFVVDGKNRQHHTTDYQESDLTFKFGRFLQAHHGGVEVCGFIAFIFFYFCLREAIVETVAECFVVDGKNRQHHTTDYQGKFAQNQTSRLNLGDFFKLIMEVLSYKKSSIFPNSLRVACGSPLNRTSDPAATIETLTIHISHVTDAKQAKNA
uniref:Uncharacterized protein n=1 Tax=Glossina palpalis gambiensis TaxID=67801 RepID=A0A1B0B6M8_9MUSC